MLSTSIKKVLCKAIVLLFSFCLPLFLLTATPLSPISGLAKDTEESQHSENHVFLHNYNETDTVITCKAAEPVVAGLAIAATGVSTVTAANDIVEITTGVSPLKEGVVALGGNEDIYNGIRTGLDVATMLTPGGGGKTKVVEGALGFAASHTDDAARVASTHADNAARVLQGGTGTTTNGVARNAVSNPLENIQYTPKVQNQMSNAADAHHNFPTLVDTMGSSGTIKPITGGDGVVRTSVEILGSINNKEGVYQYIIEPDGTTVNHRLFVPN
jgi:hypothetical protein